MQYQKPLPRMTTLNVPFWDGLRSHEFRVPRCLNCGDLNWVPYPACRGCLSEDQQWVTVSGDATVWSWTVVHRDGQVYGFDMPFAVVLAKLVEEPQACIVAGTLVGADLESLSIGMPIKVVYQDIAEEQMTMFQFAPR